MTSNNDPYDRLFNQVAGVLRRPQDQWPAHLLHYTKLSSFQKIVETKSIVLFNPLTMNDRNEMIKGAETLVEALTSDASILKNVKAMDAMLPGFPPKLAQYIHERIRQDTASSYIFCLSEPDPDHPTGSLSMWRAYGADGAGVCVCFNASAIAATYQAMRLPVVLYAVRYETKEQFRSKIGEIIAQIASVAGQIEPLWKDDEKAVLWAVYQLLMIAVATHKHPGFSEEREWRAISFASFADADGMLTSDVFPSGNGLRVGLRFDLEKYASAVNVAIDQLLSFVILGPSEPERQHASGDAVLHLLQRLTLTNPASRIRVCKTPYRTNK